MSVAVGRTEAESLLQKINRFQSSTIDLSEGSGRKRTLSPKVNCTPSPEPEPSWVPHTNFRRNKNCLFVPANL